MLHTVCQWIEYKSNTDILTLEHAYIELEPLLCIRIVYALIITIAREP
jgi:hypothetical protein